MEDGRLVGGSYSTYALGKYGDSKFIPISKSDYNESS